MKLGLITYDTSHLKTEQLALRYNEDDRIEEVKIFALPFQKRKKRKTMFSHRPNMSLSIPTKELAELEKISFRKWDGGADVIADECDFFVIGGAGILNIEFAKGKPIINAHPGIIPITRGLDSFKWAIYNGDPIGVTLHLIDSKVDMGEILSIKKTPVFLSDSLKSLSMRHYEIEIEMMANVIDVIEKRAVPEYEEKPATMRMNEAMEEDMIKKFENWKKKYAISKKKA